MADFFPLRNPWLVAIWPGMGNVALNAGVYLLAKLEMVLISELESGELFDVDHVEVKEGIIQPGRRPRNRFYLRKDPHEKRDLVVFLGEAQPPVGKYPFCRRIISYAKELGVERVVTFAAMATQMHPKDRSRVLGAATDSEGVAELTRLELEILQGGNIGGLNGVLLGVAAEEGLRGECLLGEMPHIFAQLVFPKASLAILEVFDAMAKIDLDTTELEVQVKAMEQQLGVILDELDEGFERPEEETAAAATNESGERELISANDRATIDKLFEEAKENRSKAFELKQTLDRLGVFKAYEDRFLDLFRKRPT